MLDIEKRKNARLSDIVYGDFELLKNDYAFLKQCNEQLTDENQSLKDSNDKLKAQMNRDHENSSIPSSKERFPKKIKNSRVKSGKKPGAQHGHIGHKRPHMAPTKPVITIPVPYDIISNPDYYMTGKMITKQVCDIEVSVSVTEYTTPEYRSRSTGKRGHAPFPKGVINEFNYGPKFINEKENEYSKILSIATSEYLNHPPKKYYPDGFNLYKRMEKYKENHLLFLRHPEINYTNNLSERSLRKFKRKQI